MDEDLKKAPTGARPPADEGVGHSGDPGFLGEDPRSTDPEDAVHWAAVYEELLEGVSHAVPVDGSDHRLRRTVELWGRRLRYWRERQRSL